MKSQLINTQKKEFTRQEFMRTTGTSSYYFNQALHAGLIIDTEEVFLNRAGSPIVYRLAGAFLNYAETQQSYSLDKEDLDMLLTAKSTKVAKLNDSIRTMEKQVVKLKKQKALLANIKLS